MNRDRQYENHTKSVIYWRKQARKIWASMKQSDSDESSTHLQYNKTRYLRRARRYQIRGMKRL